MVDAFQALMEEHSIILEAIHVLNQSTTKIKSDKRLPQEFFDTLLKIIQKFADKCHHGKEEAVLFPLIRQRNCSQTEVISTLLKDHQKGRDSIVALKEALSRNDAEGVIQNSAAYSEQLQSHIDKENQVFPIWFRELGSKDKEDLFEQFEEIEEKVIGIGKHEEYLHKIESLKAQVS